MVNLSNYLKYLLIFLAFGILIVVLGIIWNAQSPAPQASIKTGACSRQTGVNLEMFHCTPGIRGSITVNNALTKGWILLDTGATYTLFRTPDKKVPAEGAVNALLTLGTEWTTNLNATFSKNLWNFKSPAGGQISTLGTDFFKLWAVRISTRDGGVYFSDDAHACSNENLIADEFHRLDTAGYYQRNGKKASVGKWLAPTVPTIEVNLLGVLTRAQLDTGYSSRERQIQINLPLFENLKDRLGERKGVKRISGKDLDFYEPRGAFTLIDSETKSAFGNPQSVVVIVKKGSGGIADWSMPAAQISAKLFFDIIDDVELRADQRAIWVHTRKTPINPSELCDY